MPAWVRWRWPKRAALPSQRPSYGQGAQRSMAAAAEQPFGPGPFARMAASSLVYVSTYIFLALPCHPGKGPTARPLGPTSANPMRADEVVHVHAGRYGSFSCQWVISQSGELFELQSALPQQRRQLRRLEELRVVMGTARQQPRHVFGSDDRQRERDRRAVERGEKHAPARFRQRRQI